MRCSVRAMCPYCGKAQKKTATVKSCKQHYEMVFCEPNEGGCDRPYLMILSVEVRAVTGMPGAAQSEASA